ncbi:MAG: DMT family transporter [Proteobacteria bacterium]|nr:DMT family transporter [Pseudomonadota bacterium]
MTLAAGARPLPLAARVVGLMAGSAVLAATVNGIFRLWGQEVHPFVVAFLYNLSMLVFMLPVTARRGLAALKTTRHGLYLARGASSAVAVVTWAAALAHLSIDKATALNFTVPVFTTLGAVLVLGESVGWRRLAAVAVGLAGSLLILRPGFGGFEAAALLPLVTAAAVAATMLMIKSLARTEPSDRVVFYLALYTTLFTAVPALYVWRTPPAELLLWMVALGAASGGRHVLATRAFAIADASLVAPLDFFRLPFGALVGFLAFGELMDGPSWIGAAVIFAAAMLIAEPDRPPAKAGPAAPAAGPPG